MKGIYKSMESKEKLKNSEECNLVDNKSSANNFTGIVLTSITFLIALTLIFPLAISLVLVVITFTILFVLENIKLNDE